MSYYTNGAGRRFCMPEPAIEPDDEPPTCYCKRCGGEIYKYESLFYEDGEPMHAECFEEYVKELLKNSPDQIAELFGLKYEEGF